MTRRECVYLAVGNSFLALMDAVSTFTALQYSEVMEGNPFMRGLMESYGLLPTLFGRVLVGVLVAVIIFALALNNRSSLLAKSAQWLSVGVFALMTLIVTNNLAIILALVW